MAHEFRHVQSGDCRIRVAVEGSGPLVLMVHGFPESWSAFEHQMAPIAAAGFTAAAIDVRGYGGSDRPHAVEAYDMASIIGDLQAVADELACNGRETVGISERRAPHDRRAPVAPNQDRLAAA